MENSTILTLLFCISVVTVIYSLYKLRGIFKEMIQIIINVADELEKQKR